MSDYAPPNRSTYFSANAPAESLTTARSRSPWATQYESYGQMVTVRFDRSGRTYQYWCPSSMPDGTQWVRVLAPSGFEVVEVLVRHAVHVKQTLKAITGYWHRDGAPEQDATPPSLPPPHQYNSRKEKLPMSGIKITNTTFVNGVDVKTIKDETLYDLLAKEHKAIADLEALPVQPKKLLRQIESRKAALQALADLIDSDEPSDDKPAE